MGPFLVLPRCLPPYFRIITHPHAQRSANHDLREPFQNRRLHALALLKRKLDDTHLPHEVNAAEWAYGAPLADIRRLASRWKGGYDWRTHERELNAVPMFTRTIAVDGFCELSVHYAHQRSAAEGAIPLLFVHGCTSVPSSSSV
jgi:hypothetical protein